MPADRIREQQARDDLQEFIRDQADLDDLAELYSKIIANGPMVVVSDRDKTVTSEVYEDGEKSEYYDEDEEE